MGQGDGVELTDKESKHLVTPPGSTRVRLAANQPPACRYCAFRYGSVVPMQHMELRVPVDLDAHDMTINHSGEFSVYMCPRCGRRLLWEMAHD